MEEEDITKRLNSAPRFPYFTGSTVWHLWVGVRHFWQSLSRVISCSIFRERGSERCFFFGVQRGVGAWFGVVVGWHFPGIFWRFGLSWVFYISWSQSFQLVSIFHYVVLHNGMGW
jgi:hypothetical protein